MSVFMDMLVEMLPMHSALQKEDNPVRKVLEKSVGEYMDNLPDVEDELFLTSASGGWLDAHGRDYGVPRRIDEDDESYRERIIFEKLEHLTAGNLNEIYGLTLYYYLPNFNAHSNSLTSDNPYISTHYMSIADEDTQKILNNKFIIDNMVIWLNEYLSVGKIIDIGGNNIINEFMNIYDETNPRRVFRGNEDIKMVELDLPKARMIRFEFCTNLTDVTLNLPKGYNMSMMFEGCSSLENVNVNAPEAITAQGMFYKCVSLEDIDLNLPNTTDCVAMFDTCSALKNVKLNLPSLSDYQNIFYDASNIETINVTIPSGIVSGFKSYVEGLNLSNLQHLIINGVEYVS